MTSQFPYGFPEAPTGKSDQPCLIISNDSIVDLYNARRSEDRQFKNVNNRVKKWFTGLAKQAGWSQVKWYCEYDAPRGLAALLIYKHNDTTIDQENQGS
ncbi:MAG: hypothetical protein RIB58_14015 [Phycisphaerales bacterium]